LSFFPLSPISGSPCLKVNCDGLAKFVGGVQPDADVLRLVGFLLQVKNNK